MEFSVDEAAGKSILDLLSQLELPEKILLKTLKNFNGEPNEVLGRCGVVF